MTDALPLDVYVVAHTHWDREWYHAAGRFRQQLVVLVDALLDSSASGDSFLLDGQAVVLDDYLAVRPERREELAARLRAGSLEAGPWYVLADELIPSGEALVRNLLAGRRTLAELGASAPPVLYSPDAFGHPAAFPTLAREFGFSLIVLWRGFGGDAWPPGDTFRWRAPDGGEALLYHLPREGYEFGSSLPSSPVEARARWRRMRAELAPRTRLGVLLVLNGADHHARQHDWPDAIASLTREAAPDRVVPATLGAFAREITRRASAAGLPRVSGELRSSYGYTWTLQGTLAARAALKRRNAMAERLLVREAEPWSALATLAGGRDRGPLVRAAWKTLLLCHPHDTLCGCSTDEVARAMAARLDDVITQGTGIRDDALLDALGHDPVAARAIPDRWRSVVVVRNNAARERGGVCELDVALLRARVRVGPGSGGAGEAPRDTSSFVLGGGRVPVQVLDRAERHDRVESAEHYPHDDLVDAVRVAAWVDPVAGYGTLALTLEDGIGATPVPPASVRAGARWLENDELRVEVDDKGCVALVVRSSGRRIERLVRLEDVGDAGDLYTHSAIAPVLTTDRCVDVELVHRGPLRGELRLAYELDVPVSSSRLGRARERTPLIVHVGITLDAAAPFARVRVWGQNAAADHRLRTVFATGIRGGDVCADAMFGPVRREKVRVAPASAAVELPPPTAPLARYVTAAGPAWSVTIYSDGLAEYEATSSGDVAVTLLRAVGELSRNDLPERPGHAGWPVPTPEGQSPGAFEAAFAIFPHGACDSYVIDNIERVADDVLVPLTGSTLRSGLRLPPPTDGVRLDGAGLAFSATRISDDDAWIVVRCVNLLDVPAHGRWAFGSRVREARLSRLDETPGEPLVIADNGVVFRADARAVVTVLVR